MIDSNEVKHDKKLVTQIKKFIEAPQKEEVKDTEVIKYNDWLKSKIE